MVINDTLLLVFTTRGAGSVIAAHAALANAQQQVAAAQHRIATTSPLNGPRYMSAWRSYQTALTRLSGALTTEAARSAAGAALLFAVMDNVLNRYVKFGAEIMNVMTLTGASSKDSVAAVMMAKAAGMNDTTEIRELMRSGSAVFSGKGQAALARLGIPSNPNQSGLSIINQVSDRLQQMPDGLRKTQIMEDIFGQRGVAAMLPLLRLTKQQREEILALSSSFGTEGLPAIQEYQAATAILGQTLEQKVIFPIAQQLLPVFTRVTRWITMAIKYWDALAPFGKTVASWIAAMVGFGLAIAGAVRAVMYLVNAYRVLAATQAFQAIVAGDMSVIGRVALGASVAAGAVWGIDWLTNKFSDGASGGPENKMQVASNKMLDAATRMGDAVDKLRGGGIPGGIGSADINAIWQQGAIHAVG